MKLKIPFIWKQWTGDPPAWERFRTEGPSEIWSDGTTFATKGMSINSIRSGWAAKNEK
jgi:hypothetical protein